MQDSPLIFGIHPVLEAIQAGKQIDKIYIQRDARSEGLNQIRQLAMKMKLHFQFVPIEKLNRLTHGSHQGVVATSSGIDYADLSILIPTVFEDGNQPFIIILDRITDVRNFGAVCRTALCAGADAVVIPAQGAAMINSDAMKASAGALSIIPVCKEDNLKNTLKFLKDSGLKVFACTEKADKPYFEADFKGPLALIMGSEEDGVSAEYLKYSDEQVKIPMSGRLGSLNVSVAAGIVMFEVFKQRE
jgi:23S rRNA (guanosine2251-2'-O)-methyltransferase